MEQGSIYLKGSSSKGRGLFSHQDRKRGGAKLVLTAGWVLLAAGALILLGPIFWMILGSLKSPEELYSVPPTYLPPDPRLDNYSQALNLVPFVRYFLNSLGICAATVVGQLLVGSMAAYSLSKLRPRFGGAVLLLFATSLMVPMEVLVIPLYLIMRSFPFGDGLPHVNLINTYSALVLPAVFNAFTIMVLKEAYDTIPDEILYAARIDGCGEALIFWRFILPMTGSILAVLAIFAFVTTWNSFFWPLIVLNNPDFYPLVLGVQKLIDMGEPWNVVLAALTLSTLPSVCLLVFFQKTIIRGIAYTGIYG